MGKLVIDGNSVFEVDEECMKRRKPPKDCDVEQYATQPKRREQEPRGSK